MCGFDGRVEMLRIEWDREDEEEDNNEERVDARRRVVVHIVCRYCMYSS